MIRRVLFATTNKGKIKEASELLQIPVEGVGLPIDEVQSLDSQEVALKKAKSYYKEINKPILVEDVSLTFKALDKLPGPYINDFFHALGNEGLVELLKNKKDRSATAQTILVYIDKDQLEHTFIGQVKGNISSKPKGTNGFGWDPIFIPQGETKTFAQMTDKQKHAYSMRAKAFLKFKKWLEKQK